MRASKEASRQIYETIVNKAKVLDTPLSEIALFCNVNASTMRGMYKSASGTFNLETFNKLKRGLERIDNGEYDGRIIVRNRKSGTSDERARQRYEEERALIAVRCMDGERRKQARIKAAQEAELAKYGKTTIGNRHVTDGIA